MPLNKMKAIFAARDCFRIPSPAMFKVRPSALSKEQSQTHLQETDLEIKTHHAPRYSRPAGFPYFGV
jgi:hypothetical protein